MLFAALLLGGLRDPRLFAVGATAVWVVVWMRRTPLGPAAAWLPWLGWALLSCLLSASPLSGLPVLARWSAVLAYASLAAAWDEQQRAQWVRMLLASAAALGAAAVATGAARGWRNSMTGLLPPYYNYTVFVLVAAAAGAAAWVAHPRGPRGGDRLAAWGVCALSLACIFLANSRGGLLGLGAALLVWTARRRGWRLTAAAGAGLGCVLALALLLPASRSALLKDQRIRREARPEIWKAALRVACDSPVLGEGPGRFLSGFRRHPVPSAGVAARWGMETPYAHSEVLQAAAETGWPGLLLWLLGASAALRVLLRRQDPDPVREAAALAAAAMSAQLLADDMLQIPALAALWLSALAVAGPVAEGRRWHRGAVALGAALALTAWVPQALALRDSSRAAALFPADADVREALAWRAEEKSDLDEARSQWAQAQALSPFNALYPARAARLAAIQGRWRQAEELSSRALVLEPGFLRMRLLRADAFLHLGRRVEAQTETAELRGRLSLPAPDAAFGYEREVVEFSGADRAMLSRVESAARRR